jgi:CheY-like chemotaxis protein
VDDDRRVVELLAIALGAYGFRVLQAADGEEALRVALRERPDLIVLDVRLPRKSGLEVCERLRQDPDDPHVPIIMVSAAVETESRLQGLARGADDYVAKPFSPKELIARIRNLLARSAESRDARRRGLLAERELQGARDEAKRHQEGLKDEQHLRDLGRILTWSFEGLLDDERLAARILLETRSRIGAEACALFRAAPGDSLAVLGTRGDLPAWVSELQLPTSGELAVLLRGLGRPARLRELERFRDLSEELATLAAAGFTVLAPLRGPDGLEGVLATAERADGRDLTRHDLEVLAVLAEASALALQHAAQARAQAECLLETLAPMAHRAMSRAQRVAAAEAEAECGQAAAAELSSRTCSMLNRAVTLVPWALSGEGRRALDLAAERDLSGWCRQVQRLISTLEEDGAAPDLSIESRRAAALLRTAFDSLTEPSRARS